MPSAKELPSSTLQTFIKQEGAELVRQGLMTQKKLDAVLDGTTSRLDIKTAEKALSTAFTAFGLGGCKGNFVTIYEAAQRYTAALFELHDRQKSERPIATALETGKDYANLTLQRIGDFLRLNKTT